MSEITPQDALAALRRYSRDTSRGLYAAEAVEVLKYIATLEANQKPLIEVGRFKGEIRMEGNTSPSPQELPPLQFALHGNGVLAGYLREDGHWLGEALEQARAFTDDVACRGFEHCRIVPFREYVRTTEPKREVVELEGDVCLKGLKFALHSLAVRGYWHASPGVDYEVSSADLWPTIETAANALLHASHRYRIVGIREVPGSTVVTREEIR